MNINETEKKVLNVLASAHWSCSDFAYLSFALIKSRGSLDLDVKQIRRACRSLKRKGLAEFSSALWSEDGGPAGSGYCATNAGKEIAEPIEVPYYD